MLRSAQDFSYNWFDLSPETYDSNHRVRLCEKFSYVCHDSNHELCDSNHEGKLYIESCFSYILSLEIQIEVRLDALES